MVAERFKTTVKIVEELLKWGVLWEDTHLINEIEGEFMSLKMAINKEGKAIEIAEMACKAKSYNKLENMPLIILSLLPVNIQKQYVTAMINTPLLAIRWLYACNKYSPEEYAKCETLLDMLTLKFRDRTLTRDKFKEITESSKAINAYHRELVKANRIRINQENWIYNNAVRNKFYSIIEKDKGPDKDYDNSQIECCHSEMKNNGILTKEGYEEMFKTANILDLLAYMNVAMKLGVDPELIKAYIKKELLTNKNIVLSKIFLAMKQNGEWLYMENRTSEIIAEEERANLLQREFWQSGSRYDLQEEIMKGKSKVQLELVKHIYGYRNFEKAYISDIIKKDSRNMMFFLEDILYDALSKLRRIPGTGIFGIDCSGSMRGSSVGEHLPCELFDLAIIMAYQGHMSFEKSKIILSGGRDNTGGRHEVLDEAIYDKAPLKLGEFMVWLKKCYFNSKIGGGGIYTRELMNYIKTKLVIDKKDNVIIYCDSGDVAARMWDGGPILPDRVIDHCKVWIINVEFGTRGRRINYDEFGADIYIRGHSDYLMELISSANGVASVYEKGAAVSGASFRGLF